MSHHGETLFEQKADQVFSLMPRKSKNEISRKYPSQLSLPVYSESGFLEFSSST